MKVKILKTWIRHGRIMQPGEVIDLSDEQVSLALERGLAAKHGRKTTSRRNTGGRGSV